MCIWKKKLVRMCVHVVCVYVVWYSVWYVCMWYGIACGVSYLEGEGWGLPDCTSLHGAMYTYESSSDDSDLGGMVS